MSFSPQTAICCAKLIDRLYNGLPPTINNAKSDTQVYIEQVRDEDYLIAFPGSASIRDWITNFTAWRRQLNPRGHKRARFTGCSVHEGFIAAFRTVRYDIRDLVPAGTRVTITGHSLGGALATLCAMELFGRNAIQRVITFGAPRVGDSSFAKLYNESVGDVTDRIVGHSDPVPYVPPWLWGYRHTATEVFVADDHQVQISRNRAAAFQQRASSVIEAALSPDRKMFEASAHSINTYIERLGKIRPA